MIKPPIRLSPDPRDGGRASRPTGPALVPAAPIMTAIGRGHEVLLFPDGRVECKGPRAAARCRVPKHLGPAVAVAAGWSHSAALLADGRVACWGHDGKGQIAIPSGLGPVAEISAADRHTALRLADGRTRVFGVDCRGVPWEVPAPCVFDLLASSSRALSRPFGDALADRLPAGRIVEIASGMHHRIALADDGRVLCWGGTELGQCDVPTALGRAVAIGAGLFHSVALDDAGRVFCWGTDHREQCSIPPGLGPMKAIAVGDRHTVALLRDGRVAWWGRFNRREKVMPKGLPLPVRAIHAHRGSSWAVDADGRLHCWGDCLRTQRIPFTLTDEAWLEFATRTWNKTQRQIFPLHIRRSPQFKAIRALHRLAQA